MQEILNEGRAEGLYQQNTSPVVKLKPVIDCQSEHFTNRAILAPRLELMKDCDTNSCVFWGKFCWCQYQT